jgi:hypothetical protein
MKRSYKALLTASLAAAVFGAPHSPTFAETSGTTDVNLSIDPTLSIALSTNHIEFDGNTPNFLTNNMTVTGATNSANGYTISFNVNNEYTSLKHQSQTVSENIPTLSGTTAVSSFPNVAWGYTNSLNSASDEVSDSTNFSPIPQTSTNVFETSANGSASHIFTTGVKVNGTIPAGAYSNDLLFTIVANYVEEPEGPLEPYDGVTMSNSWYLQSEILHGGIDHERFDGQYFTSSSSSTIGISDDGKTFSGQVTFLIPRTNAFAMWTVDLTNNGEDSAMLASPPVVSGLTDAQKEFMDVRIKYEFGTPIQPRDLIRPGEMKRVLIEATYKEGYNGETHMGEPISFTIEFPYAKANHHAREVHDGAGWLNISNISGQMYTKDTILALDSRRKVSIKNRTPFNTLKDDGVVVSLQRAYERDLSNAVELESGQNYVDISLMQDGSVIAWMEENTDGNDYDGATISDKKFYDYYVYTPQEEVIVGQCEYLFFSMSGELKYASKIDLHGFNLEQCTSAHDMFEYVGSTPSDVDVPFELDLGDWTGSNLRYINDTFVFAAAHRPNGATIKFSDNWYPENAEQATYMFHYFAEDTKDVTIDVSNWQMPNVLDVSFMFADLGDNSENSVTIIADDLYTPRATNLHAMFYNVGNDAKYNTISAENWNHGNPTDMKTMFSNTCMSSKLERCDVDAQLNTASVTDMSSMFSSYNLSSLSRGDINLGSFNTANVTNMSGMFGNLGFDKADGPGKTYTLDLTSFNTSNVTNMSSFFSLKSWGYQDPITTGHIILDLSSFDFSNVTNGGNLIQVPAGINDIKVYVKDQASKEFVINNSQAAYSFIYSLQDSDVIIK